MRNQHKIKKWRNSPNICLKSTGEPKNMQLAKVPEFRDSDKFIKKLFQEFVRTWKYKTIKERRRKNLTKTDIGPSKIK